MDRHAEATITNSIGENLDRLITLDWRGQGHMQPLYNGLRARSEGPLSMLAAKRLVEKVKEGDTVFILTGFPVGPFDVFREGKARKNMPLVATWSLRKPTASWLLH